MRDIRGDLQDRTSFLEEQIIAARAQFEKRMELFTREHEQKIADLQAELEAVNMLMDREYRRIMSAPDVEDERRQAQAEPDLERGPVAGAHQMYDETDYLDEASELLPEDDPYIEPDVEEAAPSRQASPAPEARPARREPEPRYAQHPAARAEAEADEEYRPPVTADARPRRPIPIDHSMERPAMERPAAERRPVETDTHQPAARAPEPARPALHRQEAPRSQQAPRSQETPRRQEAPRRDEQRLRRESAPGEAAPGERAPRERGAVSAQRQPLADFLIRKLGEAGTMSLDDLCGTAIREGYFAEGDNPDRTVHMTLMNVVKAGFIRQMPNGTFAPASVMDTIRLRRAI